ncbi:MAG: thioredoxin family protein [Bacteroidota bacterium]|jgi:peroxiredoxin
MLQIGDKLPEFNLIGYDDKMHSSFEYADKYALAIIFTSNGSPVSVAYSNRLIKLFEKYEDDNLGIIGINSNDSAQSPEDSLEKIKLAAYHYKLDQLHFMYLKDETQEVAKKFGATTNPEVFLFNSKRELVYKGAIDDNWESESAVTSAYLEDAIEEALDGMEIDFPEIPCNGNPIIWKK